MLCLQRYDFPAKFLFIWSSFPQEICSYLHSLLFYLFWCRREAEEAGGVALALSLHHHHHLLNKASWRRRVEEIVIRKNRLDPDMPAYDTEVVNKM